VVRGMLYFQDTEALDYYYYGQLGYWRYTNRFIIGSQSFESDSGVGIGVGVGLDYDLLEAVPEFIPLTISIEAGIGYVAWGDYSGFDLLTGGKQRVDPLASVEQLVVQVGCGGAPGVANVANDLTPFDLSAPLEGGCEAVEVGVGA